MKGNGEASKASQKTYPF